MLFTQAAERGENLKEQRRTEEREKFAEMWHTVTSDMMTERAEAAETDVGGGRPPHILPDRWKGMSAGQLNAIHREQEQQRLDRQVLYWWQVKTIDIVILYLWLKRLHYICYNSAEAFFPKQLTSWYALISLLEAMRRGFIVYWFIVFLPNYIWT